MWVTLLCARKWEIEQTKAHNLNWKSCTNYQINNDFMMRRWWVCSFDAGAVIGFLEEHEVHQNDPSIVWCCLVMLCTVMLCIVMLCIVMLCIVMLCIAMLCNVMLCIVCAGLTSA
jgi:hypothetical protein